MHPDIDDQYGLLRGSWDLHAHSGPDLTPRSLSDRQLTKAAADAGMAGIVLKNHSFCTTDRAALAMENAPEHIRVLGGVVLNHVTIGGLNVEAVRANLQLGAKIIWLPTLSAANHISYVLSQPRDSYVRTLTTSTVPVELFDGNGSVHLALDRILELVASFDAVLASGHLSPEEICRVFARGRELGVSRFLINHVDSPIIAMPLDIQIQLSHEGVVLEHCYLNWMDADPAGLVAAIRTTGVESTVISTDLGQAFNPSPVEGLHHFHRLLLRSGITPDELRAMSVTNPARLLDEHVPAPT